MFVSVSGSTFPLGFRNPLIFVLRICCVLPCAAVLDDAVDDAFDDDAFDDAFIVSDEMMNGSSGHHPFVFSNNDDTT